ncbi:MAG: hypothetical protein LQ338_006505 [Usnochroma carphineum]|nr:MAG: hypothetical protein LQ338_006505 [Usnochroma carphineum]
MNFLVPVKEQFHRSAGTFIGLGSAAKSLEAFHEPRVIFSSLAAIINYLSFHGYSLWLFTFSDLKTIVGPSLVFGIANGLAASNYELEIPSLMASQEVRRRTPLVVLWIWMNLLPFTINNQTAEDAIEEDRINKPWRTVPSGRMSPRQAKNLMLALYPLAIVTALLTGGVRQSTSLVILGVWYNNFAGGDISSLLRNMINAFGYVCFTSGAMEVALGIPLPLSLRLVRWFGVLAAVIFSTVHLQDMYDQMGDQARGRKTVPLVIGDGKARWSISFAMIFWGYVCPRYWHGGTMVSLMSILLATVIAARGLLLRTVSSDRLTFKIWNAWMTLVFVLPLLSQREG